MTDTVLDVTDLFCGGGGSSLGAEDAGAEIGIAMNHWQRAVETYSHNHPGTFVDCADISECNPKRYRRTRILIGSPECTNHTLSKGKKRKGIGQPDLFNLSPIDPSEERSRATMWDIPRFAEVHDYDAIIVENVVEARWWIMWDAWLMAMHALGYKHKCVYFNSMFAHPTPQSRDRMYVVFWKRIKDPDLNFRPKAWCQHCQGDIESVQAWKPNRNYGAYREQYIYCCPKCSKEVTPYYYCAYNCIDWTLPAPKIGERGTAKYPKLKPLSENTLRRIQKGLDKYGRAPTIMETAFSHAANVRSSLLVNPSPTMTTQQTKAIVIPPYIISLRGQNAPKDTSMPVDTVCASGNHHGLVIPPMLVGNYSPGWTRPVTEPTGTITTSDHHGLVVPPYVVNYYKQSSTSGISDPVPTITTVQKQGIVIPPFISSYYNRDSGVAASRITEPLPTQGTWPLHYLVDPSEGIDVNINDCGYRMLSPEEIKLAMGFPEEYKLLGTNRERVKLAGNAVTPPVMKMIFERIRQAFDH